MGSVHGTYLKIDKTICEKINPSCVLVLALIGQNWADCNTFVTVIKMQVHCCDNEGQEEVRPDIDCQSIKFSFEVGASPNVRSAAREIGRSIRLPDATRR